MSYQGTATGIATGMSYQLQLGKAEAQLSHLSSFVLLYEAEGGYCDMRAHMLRTPMYIASLSPEIESTIIIIIIHNANVPTFTPTAWRVGTEPQSYQDLLC